MCPWLSQGTPQTGRCLSCCTAHPRQSNTTGLRRPDNDQGRFGCDLSACWNPGLTSRSLLGSNTEQGAYGRIGCSGIRSSRWCDAVTGGSMCSRGRYRQGGVWSPSYSHSTPVVVASQNVAVHSLIPLSAIQFQS